MSCSNGCGSGCSGGGPGPYRAPIVGWRDAGAAFPGMGVEAEAGPGQPGRAPAGAAGGRDVPWWAWLLIALLAFQLIKKGPA
jgi:hypothetical protein